MLIAELNSLKQRVDSLEPGKEYYRFKMDETEIMRPMFDSQYKALNDAQKANLCRMIASTYRDIDDFYRFHRECRDISNIIPLLDGEYPWTTRCWICGEEAELRGARYTCDNGHYGDPNRSFFKGYGKESTQPDYLTAQPPLQPEP
jgi:hypothetical protein